MTAQLPTTTNSCPHRSDEAAYDGAGITTVPSKARRIDRDGLNRVGAANLASFLVEVACLDRRCTAR